MSAEGQIKAPAIPEDIMLAAREAIVAEVGMGYRLEWDSGRHDDHFAVKAVVRAIFAERKRSAAVAKTATMMTGAPLEEMGDEVAAAVLSQPETRKFWMVYGHGQRAPAFVHGSKQAAQAEAQRLAALHPGIMFAVLAAVDAYLTETPTVQRFKIVKPEPSVDYDDGIPF